MKRTKSNTSSYTKGIKFNITNWNVANDQRVVTHDPNSRFNLTKRKGANQYSRGTVEYFDHVYEWLIGCTKEVTNVTGHFTCWIPEGEGIELTDSGYNRMDYSGKHFCHRFVWLYHNPGKNVLYGYDVSHLCGNSACCRSSHLICEPKPDNIARINCIGYLVRQGNPNHILKICPHNIPCKKAIYFSENDIVKSIGDN
jgi:hypothetical protein